MASAVSVLTQTVTMEPTSLPPCGGWALNSLDSCRDLTTRMGDGVGGRRGLGGVSSVNPPCNTHTDRGMGWSGA